jgi:hypothetical protein
MTTYNINHPPRNLQHSDKIVFHVPGHNRLEYKVFSDHIGNRIDGCNRRVFIELGIGDEDDYSMGSPTVKVCSAAYGYPAGDGNWPIFHAGDYGAATRIVNHVFSLIAQLTLLEEMKQSTINHPQGFIPRRILKYKTGIDDLTV